MSYLNKNLNSFLFDISKGNMGTPFGGSVIMLSVLANIQLFSFVLNYTIKKTPNISLEKYLDILIEKKAKLQDKLDLDIKIVENIINAYKSKNSLSIKHNLEYAAESSLDIFENIFGIGELIEKSSFDIKKAVLSDLAIVNETYYSNLTSLHINIFINLFLLKKNNPTSQDNTKKIEIDVSHKLDIAFEKKQRIIETINSRLNINFNKQ